MFAVCIDNSEYPASLELHKVYQVLPDEDAAVDGDMRVIDESGEDYLYPADYFIILASIEKWEGFDVGAGDDFDREVILTGQNEELLRFLKERRSHRKRILLAEVKEELGIE